MNRAFEISFWIIVSIVLVIIFGYSSGNYIHALYFVSFFIPVTIATSWFINSFLITGYLIRKKYFKFFLYLLYTIIISVNLTYILVFVALLLIAFYDFENLGSIMTDFRMMPLVLYTIVLIYGFIYYVNQYIKFQSLTESENNDRVKIITVRSERKNRLLEVKSIMYIESMADYVRIFLDTGDRVITRSNISFFESKLGDRFLRIHRSYLVNRENIESYTREKIILAGKELPVSRTYKDNVIKALV